MTSQNGKSPESARAEAERLIDTHRKRIADPHNYSVLARSEHRHLIDTMATLLRPAPVEAVTGGVEAVTSVMVDAAWNEAKTRRMTGLPNDFRAVLEAAMLAAMPAAPVAFETVVDREAIAKVVYAAMKWAAERAENGRPPEWVERGNSTAQVEARRFACDIMRSGGDDGQR